MSTEITLIVVAYNRPHALTRLLNSLATANYFGDKIRLYISIDHSNENSVYEVADSFLWSHGEKIVSQSGEHLGLRRHVLQCGDLTTEYDRIIVLEDDLLVSPLFYDYTRQALNYYADDDRIGGIALYTHRLNQTVHRPFLPINDGYDVFFMQYACSLGQAWTAKQWQNFNTWYNLNSDTLKPHRTLPRNVSLWPESSWLKYYIKYLIDTDRYFLYPYTSLTTNFGDIGTHFTSQTNIFHVPIYWCDQKVFDFVPLELSSSVYDAFFENMRLADYLPSIDDPHDVTIDLYGSKQYIGNRYLLTIRELNFPIIASYSLEMAPHDSNIIAGMTGTEAFLYDMHSPRERNFGWLHKRRKDYRQKRYDSKCYQTWAKYLMLYIAKAVYMRLMRIANMMKYLRQVYFNDV